jgi:ABC-type multidrug transport system fused ATPase/permease subunit
VVSGLIPILAVAALGKLVDRAAGMIRGRARFSEVAWWLVALLLANGCEVLFELLNRWRGENVRERLRARAQERLLAKASHLPLAALERPEFYDQLHRAQQWLDDRLLWTLEYLSSVPSYLATACGLLVFVGSAHLLFPVLLLCGLIPSHLIGVRLSERRFRLARQQTASERILDYLGRLMVGRDAAAEVRLFGLQEHLLAKRQQLFRALREERLELARVAARAFIIPVVGEQLTYGMVVTGVVALIARGRLSVGYYAAYLSAAERFRDAILWLFGTARNLDEDMRFARDLLDYLDLDEEATTRTYALAPVAESQPTIRFEDVCFAYPGSERPVLDGINLTLRPHERIALVGENGAGKTTLAKLLLGLYRPTSGRITVGGIDLQEIDPNQWRARVTAVFQDYMRYALTVRENIGFGDLNRMEDREAVHAAAVKSGAHEAVTLFPNTYETVLGKVYEEGGQDLSIGQWQKLALARAYLRDAAVIVLDEPTAALDARAEVEVYRHFRDMSQGRSVLFISHRLGSARLADRILVLEGGRISEEGNHDDLMQYGGRYAQMFSIQAGWYQ